MRLSVSGSVFQRIFYRSDYTDLLDIGCVGVAVADAELSLVGMADFSELAFRVLCKLFGGFACVFGGFLNHSRLDLAADAVEIHDVLGTDTRIVLGDVVQRISAFYHIYGVFCVLVHAAFH